MGQYFGSGKGKRSAKSTVGLSFLGSSCVGKQLSLRGRKCQTRVSLRKDRPRKAWMELVLLREKIPRRQPKAVVQVVSWLFWDQEEETIWCPINFRIEKVTVRRRVGVGVE